MNIDYKSYIKLHSLNIQPDVDGYIVENKTSKDFYQMEHIAVEAIELIMTGLDLRSIESQLSEKYNKEDINMIDFVNQLIDLNIVLSVNNEEINIATLNERTKSQFEWLPQRIGRLFFNRISVSLYTLLIFVNIIIFITNPSLFPYYNDLFITNYMSLNLSIWALITLMFILLHEMGHILAIKSFGLSTNLSVGHRLFLVVFETDMTEAWRLPRKNRITIALAGIFFDSVFLFIALVLKYFDIIESTILSGILGLIILDVVLRILFQFLIFMKTDLYHVFENLTGTYNILEEGIAYLKTIVKRVTKRGEVVEENKIIKVYAFIHLAGILLMSYLFIMFYIPQLLFTIKFIILGFTQTTSVLSIIDSSINTLIMILMFVILLSSWKNKLTNRDN